MCEYIVSYVTIWDGTNIDLKGFLIKNELSTLNKLN